MWPMRSEHSATSYFLLDRNDNFNKLVSALMEWSLFDIRLLRHYSNHVFDRFLVISWKASVGKYSVDRCWKASKHNDASLTTGSAASFCGCLCVRAYSSEYNLIDLIVHSSFCRYYFFKLFNVGLNMELL